MIELKKETKVVPHHKTTGDSQGTMEQFVQRHDHPIVNFFKRNGYLLLRYKEGDRYVLWDGRDGGFYFRENDFVLYQKKRESL